jgi:ESCRT-I complex subunit VPS28
MLCRLTMNALQEIKLWADTKDRRKYEDLADLFAIFKTTEHLEAAYVRDAITPEEVGSRY